MSQDTLGKALGVGRTTVVNWENGTSTPTVEMLMDVWEVLNTTPNELLLDPSTYLNISTPPLAVAAEPKADYGVVHRKKDVAGRDSELSERLSELERRVENIEKKL